MTGIKVMISQLYMSPILHVAEEIRRRIVVGEVEAVPDHSVR
jgi:hypothetical protein